MAAHSEVLVYRRSGRAWGLEGNNDWRPNKTPAGSVPGENHTYPFISIGGFLRQIPLSPERTNLFLSNERLGVRRSRTPQAEDFHISLPLGGRRAKGLGLFDGSSLCPPLAPEPKDKLFHL